MGSNIVAISALITGLWLWGLLHLGLLVDTIGATETVYQEMVMAIIATIFTVSLIVTLFFVGRFVDASKEEREKRTIEKKRRELHLP